MDYRARFYSPYLSRFIQPDTLIPGAGHPQAWNRYSYVLNSPVRYTDPTGHYTFEGGACLFGTCDPTSSFFTGGMLRNVIGSDGRIYDQGWNVTAANAFLSPKDSERIYGVAVAQRVSYSTLIDPTNEGYYMAWGGFGGATMVAGSSMPMSSSGPKSTVPSNLVDDVQSSGGWGDKPTKPMAKGGTYILRDPNTEDVVRTGRTKNLQRRAQQHARQFPQYDFEIDWRVDGYAIQRGREQMLHDMYSPPLNRIRPISPTNRNIDYYLNAARNYLK
jgi:hypothetical protein